MSDLSTRLTELGRNLATREAEHGAALEAARKCAETLHGKVSAAIDAFHGAVHGQVPHLVIEQSGLRVDDKHLRAVEFEVARGRHRAIVVVKSRGEVTLVGPFRAGKTEEPCRSFPIGAEVEVEGALGDFLASFIEEAATP
jgi:hypothetical protein